MPALDYTTIAANALQAIQDAGTAITVTRETVDAFDPSTGDVTPGATLVASGYGVQTRYSRRDIDGTVIQIGDMRLLVASSGLAFAPEQNDTITVDSVAWDVVNVEPITPSGEDVLYICQVRR